MPFIDHYELVIARLVDPGSTRLKDQIVYVGITYMIADLGSLRHLESSWKREGFDAVGEDVDWQYPTYQEDYVRVDREDVVKFLFVQLVEVASRDTRPVPPPLTRKEVSP